ncbi:MAG TPA: GNAT family N-acetyltransferase [Thermoleophilaceae bacterium]
MTLRRWREDDVPAVAAICQDPEIPRWTNVPSPYAEDDARAFIGDVLAGRFHELALAVTDASSDELLGAVGFRLPEPVVGEVGYWVGAHARGRGVATRAVRLICEWAFEQLHLVRIQLHTLPGNVGSERVAERVGFTREGLLRSFAEMKGERVDITMFSLMPGELR